MILLDTCALLWLAMEPERLSIRACSVLENPSERVWVSAITGFELGQKQAAGKLDLPISAKAWVDRALHSHHLEEMALTLSIALRATSLPRLHADPFDRLLVATAQEHHLTLLTPDPKIHAYPNTRTLW